MKPSIVKPVRDSDLDRGVWTVGYAIAPAMYQTFETKTGDILDYMHLWLIFGRKW